MSDEIQIINFIDHKVDRVFEKDICVSYMTLLPDDRIIFITKNKDVKIWNPDTGEIDLELNEEMDKLVVLKDGRIVTSLGGTLHI